MNDCIGDNVYTIKMGNRPVSLYEYMSEHDPLGEQQFNSIQDICRVFEGLDKQYQDSIFVWGVLFEYMSLMIQNHSYTDADFIPSEIKVLRAFCDDMEDRFVEKK